jgi:hypothetical protein
MSTSWTIPLVFAAMAVMTARLAVSADLVVHLPAGVVCRSAAALSPSLQAGEDGPAVLGKKTDAATIVFTDLQSATPYDLRLVLAGGRVLHGVNMAWYTAEPARPDAGELNDDDRGQINTEVSGGKTFYDVSRVLAISGDHDRATVLVERIRQSSFSASQPGEVVWRVELWYFTNDFGGWNESLQTNKVVLRTRFPTAAEYHETVDHLIWAPLLGGIVLNKADERREMTVPAEVIAGPATRP